MDKANEKVSSLTEYIDVIKKCGLHNHYFRGENQKYSSISSSLVREYVLNGEQFGLVNIYHNLLNSYYQVGRDFKEKYHIKRLLLVPLCAKLGVIVHF